MNETQNTASAGTDDAPRTPVTVTVTGAAGQIGYASLFRIAAGEMLGRDQPVRLKLLEVSAAQRAAEGTAMELADGAFGLLEGVEIFSDPARAFDGTDVALLIGSSPRKAGMDRADLLEGNATIFAEQGRALNESAAEDVKVLVVGNPANTNALIAASHAPDVPLERFTALTRLDHNRALAQLAAATETPVGEIRRMIVWGNHSGSQVPDLDHALVAGRPAGEVLAEQGMGPDWVENAFVPTVAQRGQEIIQVRGGSSVASAAHAAICHVRDWIQGTPEGDWTSMAVPSDGSYGVEEGLISSFPVICTGGSYRIVPDLENSTTITGRIGRSVEEMLQEKTAVRRLGLLGPRDR